MFVKVNDSEYINLDQVARAEFKLVEGKYTGILTFAKPGGSDRHFVYEDDARSLEATLKSMTFGTGNQTKRK